MSVDNNFWINYHFRKNSVPETICPTCNKGYLKLNYEFRSFPTRRYKELERSDYFDVINDYEEKFTGFLHCNNQSCKDVVAVIGNVHAEPDEHDIDENGEYMAQQLYSYYQPEYFTPSLKLFQLKKGYPLAVNNAIESSFALFFNDVEACANKIRIAVEILLNELKVNRFQTSKGKRTFIPLHKRIELFKTKSTYTNRDEIGTMMLAIKLIGNFGSHKESLKKEDLIDAYNLMEGVLERLYNKETPEVIKLSKKITQRKKPMSKIKAKPKLLINTKGLKSTHTK